MACLVSHVESVVGIEFTSSDWKFPVLVDDGTSVAPAFFRCLLHSRTRFLGQHWTNTLTLSVCGTMLLKGYLSSLRFGPVCSWYLRISWLFLKEQALIPMISNLNLSNYLYPPKFHCVAIKYAVLNLSWSYCVVVLVLLQWLLYSAPEMAHFWRWVKLIQRILTLAKGAT